MRCDRVWLCLLVAGCNQLYGLDRTGTATDTDGDGAFDNVDVCPLVADDQADADEDGDGDACDICPLDPDPDQHDEDHDDLGDVCDLCPVQEDFADADDDHDGIGNACDPFTISPSLPSQRLLFDPFVSVAPEWQAKGVPWALAGDRIAPTAALAPGDGLMHTTVVLPAAAHIDIGVRTRDHWRAGDQFGIQLVDAGGVVRASCMVTCIATQTPMCRSRAIVGSVLGFEVTALEQVIVPMRMEINAPAIQTYCFAGGIVASTVDAAPLPGTKIVLIASPNAQIAYIDVVGHGQ
jgi:hypothetical protein